MIYRTKINGIEDFEVQSIAGRKVAHAATKAEKHYLIRLNNQAVRLQQKASRIADDLAEIGQRENDLYYFISEREGLL